MKAERWAMKSVQNTLQGTLLLRMATARDSRKVDAVVIRKAPCLHPNTPRAFERVEFLQIGISIVKKLKERAFSLPGKLPAPSILVPI